ncbi:hypothetical protein [Citreimonas salinaria]|uniref:Uncharacterized protein n=1 Tax=Citreimonas salinaria TaxID=321339 RepID=A0A1H3IQK1_9RHOB|nr:hypothetical protein [Citreimonas salinaria]SDY29961.1 hypothetical protein SAMN05444340_105211 [Citreimonas salinaria]
MPDQKKVLPKHVPDYAPLFFKPQDWRRLHLCALINGYRALDRSRKGENFRLLYPQIISSLAEAHHVYLDEKFHEHEDSHFRYKKKDLEDARKKVSDAICAIEKVPRNFERTFSRTIAHRGIRSVREILTDLNNLQERLNWYSADPGNMSGRRSNAPLLKLINGVADIMEQQLTLSLPRTSERAVGGRYDDENECFVNDRFECIYRTVNTLEGSCTRANIASVLSARKGRVQT